MYILIEFLQVNTQANLFILRLYILLYDFIGIKRVVEAMDGGLADSLKTIKIFWSMSR